MSTNFYVYRDVCECCNRGDQGEHIGKSGAGWAFALRIHPDDGIHDLNDWIRLWMQPGIVIKNQYGETVPWIEMLDWILKPELQEKAFHLQRNVSPGRKDDTSNPYTLHTEYFS